MTGVTDAPCLHVPSRPNEKSRTTAHLGLLKRQAYVISNHSQCLDDLENIRVESWPRENAKALTRDRRGYLSKTVFVANAQVDSTWSLN